MISEAANAPLLAVRADFLAARGLLRAFLIDLPVLLLFLTSGDNGSRTGAIDPVAVSTVTVGSPRVGK